MNNSIGYKVLCCRSMEKQFALALLASVMCQAPQLSQPTQAPGSMKVVLPLRASLDSRRVVPSLTGLWSPHTCFWPWTPSSPHM